MSQSNHDKDSSDQHILETNGAVDWPKLCGELRAELEQVKKELATAKQDRDIYLRAVKTLLPVEEFNFTKEEMLAQVCRGQSFEELIAELEKDLEHSDG